MKKKKSYTQEQQDLLKTYACYARFYEMTVGGETYNCRDVLDIIRKEPVVQPDPQKLLAKEVDAIFIMMNPGSSEPKDKENNGRKMTEAEPDDTQFQLMRVMENKKNWQHVRVLNLSDLRNPESGSFYKLFKNVESLNGKKHSIFNDSRKGALNEFWMLKENAPIIAAWGVDDNLNSLTAQCIQYLKSVTVKPIGWLKPRTKNRFYHPYSRVDKKNPSAWVRIVLEDIGGNKMKTLDEIYGEIWRKENGFDWQYYDRMSWNNKDFPIDKKVAPKFIKKYFEVGGKIYAFDHDINKFLSKKEGKERSSHSVSLFFLGIFMEKFIMGQKQTKPDFRYMWFLTSLYHDMGYFDEIEKIDSIDDDSLLVLDNFKYYKHFSEKLIKRYYYYRKSKDGGKVTDHGIASAIKLYSRLTKNYETVKNSINPSKIKDKDTENESFEKNGLVWRKKIV